MFDSHAHIAVSQFDKDREVVIERARNAGLFGWLEVGTDIEQSHKAIALAETQDGAYATVGVHPSDIGSLTESGWKKIDELLSNSKVKAVGEIGLDFYRGGNLSEQTEVLLRFLELAQKHSLPIVFHVRNGEMTDAHEELLKILNNLSTDRKPSGVIHTFSGNLLQAQKYLELGLYLSFSGVVTFKNAGAIVEAAINTPLDRILIETDCPFLAPVPYRGKRNEPAYVQYVAAKIAELHHIPVEKVIEHTDVNAHKLFNIP
ncbi:MAG: TatD family hydrolase [Candidatus Andersenbacteria bacterium]|nr:TatD family hydrolase [Candidatus Andersenbacteria bacterium]MBI3251000.1 TatD family hydrolase [Candidatus Andersenbacteria bacterium]